MTVKYYLNGRTTSGSYKIFAIDPNGYPCNLNPVINPPTGKTHIAWPNCIKAGATYKVWASTFTASSGLWDCLRLLTSTDGITFSDQGDVFTANGSETAGIGPTAIMYDPSGAQPYLMYYLIRGAPGLTIGSATSNDGITWIRQGIVYTSPGTGDEAGGVSVSYALKEDGEYIIGLHCYDNSGHGISKMLRCATATGTFTIKATILSNDAWSATVTTTAEQSYGTIPGGVTVPLGIPLVFAGTKQEINVAKSQLGTTIWFERPFTQTMSSVNVYSFVKMNADISMITKNLDGTWSGFVTGYAPDASVFAEYSSSVSCNSMAGTWAYSGTGLPFKQWLASNLVSYENPCGIIEI